MTCALQRLVPAKPLMCLLLMLVLQQEVKHSGWICVFQAAALCVKSIPQEGACITGLQGVESKRLLLTPFCFTLSRSDDWGWQVRCRDGREGAGCCCRASISSATHTVVCITREVFQGRGWKFPSTKCKRNTGENLGQLGRICFLTFPRFLEFLLKGDWKRVFFFLFWFKLCILVWNCNIGAY